MKKLILIILTAMTTLTAAPQIIIFDFGGVMVGDPDRDAVANFLCESLQLSEPDFAHINLEKRKAVSQGKSEEEFWQSFAIQKGIELPSNWPLSFQSVIKEAMTVRKEMYDLVEELKATDHRVALFSNVEHYYGQLLRQFGFYDPFELSILSCDIGVKKPDRQAYQILINRLNLQPSEILFIDDKPDNVKSAKELGIDAILFESPQQLRQELQERGIMNTHHFHQSLADGRWFTLPLVEQLGNIGSEINRAVKAQGDQIKFDYAVNRALELFYLTLSDDRWRNRRKELARAKELFNAAVLGSTAYDTTLEDLNNYFLQFAIAARINAR